MDATVTVGAGATVESGARTCGVGATVSSGATVGETAAEGAATVMVPDGVAAEVGLPVGSVMVPSVDGKPRVDALFCGAAAPSGASAEGGLGMPGFEVETGSAVEDCARSAAPKAAVIPRIVAAERPVERMRAERATCRWRLGR